ncbi:PspA/IM30 family protein [Peribacillus saganii]|uniref:PspA/IM30 family protein n=1 Tax=Peribacillus saganii TaxID=2303992 RepID=A0A372LNF2_9BACI|nr:PspA/IM30 family protein [Peribacillus saganii]RFU69141.1 PspA/IM30 family protein [Peribacillus saganii]
MKNLFNRIVNVITADIHEVLDQKEQKNPIATLNQYLRECEQETEKVRKLVERQHLLKEEFSREYLYARDLAEKRKRQAAIAKEAGESELHEFAVQEYGMFEERSFRLKDAMQKAAAQLTELERKYEEMRHKLKDMNIKRMELMGRENTVRAHYRMNQVLEPASYANQSFSRFSEMENYLERLEHKVNSAFYRNTIDARIHQLEKEQKHKETHSIS